MKELIIFGLILILADVLASMLLSNIVAYINDISIENGMKKLQSKKG